MHRDEVEALYRQHGPALLAYAASLLTSRALAEDLLHQVFLSLMKSKVPMPDNPKAYLFRAVRSATRNVHRLNQTERQQNTLGFLTQLL